MPALHLASDPDRVIFKIGVTSIPPHKQAVCVVHTHLIREIRYNEHAAKSQARGVSPPLHVELHTHAAAPTWFPLNEQRYIRTV